MALGAFALLGGCVTPRPVPGPPLSAAAQREALAGLSGFRFEGRTAITNGDTGTNASLAWRQNGADSQLRLAGPLGMGSMQVAVTEGDLHIRTSRGERIAGAEAIDALAAELGFEPPIEQLRYWVLGMPAPGGDALEELDADGRLARLEQQGWQVSYDEYRVQSSMFGALSLPRRLTATREPLRLRVVIDRWVLRR